MDAPRDAFAFRVQDAGAASAGGAETFRHAGEARAPHLVLATVVRTMRGTLMSHAAAFSVDTWAGVAIAAVGLLVALQTYLVGAHLASALAWRWAAVLVPTWTLDLALALALLYYLITASAERGNHHSDKDADEVRDTKLKIATALGLLTTLFVFEVMLVDKLDGRQPHSWQQVCIPLYFFGGLVGAFGLSLVYHNWPSDEDMRLNGSSAAYIA